MIITQMFDGRKYKWWNNYDDVMEARKIAILLRRKKGWLARVRSYKYTDPKTKRRLKGYDIFVHKPGID